MNSVVLMRIAPLAILLISNVVFAESAREENNNALTTLFKNDQDERSATPRAPWPVIEKHDVERGQAVLAMVREGGIRSATDFCHASLILHHGPGVDSARLAYSFAWIGYSLDATNKECALLTAQTWDRMMTKQGKLQWYGTQFERRDQNAKLMSPLPIDQHAVSDEERARFGVALPDQQH